MLVCSDFKNPIRYARNFRKLVKEHGPYDILHVHGSSFSGLLTLALAKFAGIRKTIVHSHNDVRPLLKSRGGLYRAYVTGVLRAYRALSDFAFAASVLAAESMFGTHWSRNKHLELLYCGIDCKPFAKPRDPGMRSKLGIAEDAFVIGHVGRFHEQKNHKFLIDVVQSGIAIHPEVHCLLIGDGALRESITNEIHLRGLQNHFTFIPDTRTVSDYMISVMDSLVFPSRYEGLGLVVVEAQAAQLPCLISDRVPAEAIVDPSLVSVLPLEKPARDWAEAALKLADIRREARHLSDTTMVENSRFNLEHCISALQARYLQLAAR